jgi:hypothetical protein
VHWVVAQPRVVQLWADNVADLSGLLNLVAADVVAYVFQLERFGLHATTRDVRGVSGSGSSPGGAQLGRRTAAGGAAAESATVEQRLRLGRAL